MPHRRHIYDKASDMAQATMCVYPMYDYAMPHWKCVLRCCADCPCMYLPDQETYYQYLDTTHSIRFHIYHIIASCYMCKHISSPYELTKIYTRKQIVMTETTVYDFYTSFYIPSIEKLAFNLPPVHIIGTNHCGEMRCTAFKRRELLQYVLCRRYYYERVVASSAHKI